MNRSLRPLALVTVLLLAVSLGWLLARATRGKPEVAVDDRSESPSPSPAPPAPGPAPAPPVASPPPRPARPSLEVAPDGIPIMPAHPGDRPDGPVHPHPITPEHERIYRENRLIGELNGAMDMKDVARLRGLLGQYRRAYPEDEQMLQDGYAVIADCIERPGEESRAVAQRWTETHRGSTLRRFVDRHCLAAPAP